MSNPCETTGDPHVDLTLSIFWLACKTSSTDASELPETNTAHEDATLNSLHLQPWQGNERVLELNQKIRSGEDVWFSNVLDECRVGKLSDANYNFLHGLPTKQPIDFWFHRRKEANKWHEKEICSTQHRCLHCETERQRRNILLMWEGDATIAAKKLADPKFKNCVYITPFNKVTPSSSTTS